MNIEDTETAEQLWSAALAFAVKRGDQFITMPCSAMTEDAAVNLALKLNISMMVRGNDYASTTTREASQALLSTNETMH